MAEGRGDGAGARSVCTEGPDWTLGGTAREGAHHEHVVHVRDTRRVEAERLVERCRLLPRVTPRHMRRATQGGGRREGVWACGSGGGSRSVHGGADWTLCGHAHLEHPAHVGDAGRVEAQRLVERRRALPCRSRAAHMARQA